MNANKGRIKRALWSTVWVSMILIVLTLSGCTVTQSSVTPNASEVSATDSASENVASSGDLVIPISGISETVTFYPAEADGTKMEVLTVKAPDGTIRTAFNTCEVCYDSGRGYYKQEGNALVCQNCGNRFETSQIGIEASGCNPWPIRDEGMVVDAENITIFHAFLEESASIFQTWKREY